MKRVRTTRTVAVAAGMLLVLLSAFAVNGYLSSRPPGPLAFTLGAAYRDVTYCNRQTLDLFVPSSPAGPRPLAIFVHGGGMSAGDKNYINPLFLNALASAGYAVASLNYRLAPQSQYPAQIEDVKCAVRFLRASAPGYDVDSSAFYAFGTSAGGQLVAIAALTGGHSMFDVGPYLNEPSNLTAVVDMFGPADLATCHCYSDAQAVYGSDVMEQELASPTHFVVPNAPPLLIVQGLDDTTVPSTQATELYDRLVAAGDRAQLVLVKNMGHMFTQSGSQPIDPSMAEIAQDLVAFFELGR